MINMFSYLLNFLNYILNSNQNKLNDDEKENFLADELLALELQSEKEEEILPQIPERELTNTVCFQRTG